ncbi:hypothetical protein FJZ53_05150 [Candidatus Woesearchaeota archaeon]|nr:hypothetical protein [Candidatus Woesearchaeota archaeon]
MKLPKTFVPENKEKLEEKAKEYVNRVEYVQKPYDEEELGVGATATLPEEVLRGLMFAPSGYGKAKDEKPPRSLSMKYIEEWAEELEKKLLEDYTTL